MQMRTPDRHFTADKVFVLVRNPIDTFASMFLFLNTASHSMTSKEKISEAFPVEWDFNIKVMAKAYAEYYRHVEQSIGKDVSIYYIRFEDQTTHTESILTDLF